MMEFWRCFSTDAFSLIWNKKKKITSPKSLNPKVNFFTWPSVFSGRSSMTLGGVLTNTNNTFQSSGNRDDLTQILSASGKPFSFARRHTLTKGLSCTEKPPHFLFLFLFFGTCTPVCVFCFTRRAPTVLCSFTCSRAKRRRRQLMALTLDVLCRGARGSARCRLRRC